MKKDVPIPHSVRWQGRLKKRGSKQRSCISRRTVSWDVQDAAPVPATETGVSLTADGLIVGSPVYFASPTGAVLSLLDRIFMAGNKFYLKPAAAVASARRAGTTATIDVLNKYFNLAGMPIVSSNYYNVIHGHTPEETRQDEEGMQTMRTLGRNMAWMLKCMEAGREKGLVMPEKEPKIKTSYIR